MQIVILGMHRSGTSLTTRLVNMMGAYFGPETSVGEITSDNPKGFWERPEVFKLNESILVSKGCTWHNLQKWKFSDAASVTDAQAKAIQKLVLGMDAFRPWVLKDPRMCLLLPAWRPYLEVPVAVIVHRNPVEIAGSLQSRDKLPLEYGMALWEHYTVGLLNATLTIPRVFVRHIDLVQKPMKTTEFLYKQLVNEGVRRLEMPSAREVKAFIDPKLYRSKPASAKSSAIKLTPNQRLLTDIMQAKQPQTARVSVSKLSQSLLTQVRPASA